MNQDEIPTVEFTLEQLNDALGRASEDLRSAQPAIEQAQVEIASRNTSVSREVIKDAERVIDHLRKADESLADVVKDLADR